MNPVTSVTSTSGTEVGGTLAGEGPIFVNVANAVNVTDASAANAVQNVADAVYQGITAAQQAQTGAIDASTAAITSGISSIVTTLDSGITQATSSIADIASGILSSVGADLGNLGSVIGNSVFNAVNPTVIALAGIAATIARQLGGLAGAIATAVAQVIPAIITAIQIAQNPPGAILAKIEQDIGSNLASLTQLPEVIAGIPTGIDAALNNIWSEYTAFTEQTTGWGTGESAHKDLQSIADAIAGTLAVFLPGAAPKLADVLETDCAGVDLQRELNRPWTGFDENASWFDKFGNILIKALGRVIQLIFSALPTVQKISAVQGQQINSACPTDLLPPPLLVQAFLRGYLTQAQVQGEAALGDLSHSRLQTMIDLATHQFSPSELTDAFYRQIIPQQDFYRALQEQGLTGDQQLIQQALGVNVLTIQELFDLQRRGTITTDVVKTGLKALHYNDTQIDAVSRLAFRPPNMNEQIAGDASADLLNGLGIAGIDNVGAIPEDVQAAAAAEGLDLDAMQARWAAHWQVGGIATWITLYFRGQVTLQQVQAVMDRQFIPRSVQAAFVDSARPLVQFRTISTMLNQQIISEAVARQLLKEHGYTDNNVDILIKYAERPSKAKAAKNARAHQLVALSIAKEEFIDGSITGDQYLSILIDHGYTSDGANTELRVVEAQQALKQRKANAQLVIDEFGAGLINEHQALLALAALGLTPAEMAHAEHRIRAFKAAKAKIPSESDLHHMLMLGIISNSDYVTALEATGYPEVWAERFLAWRQSPSGLQPSTASSIAPPVKG